MNKILLMLCVVLVLSFAGTALAEPSEKVEVCHNVAFQRKVDRFRV